MMRSQVSIRFNSSSFQETSRTMSSTVITSLFPIWALLGSLLAWWLPGFFIPLKASIVPLLGLVMFGMGMTELLVIAVVALRDLDRVSPASAQPRR